MTKRFPVCRQCRTSPLTDVGWMWECRRCGLRITTAAALHDNLLTRTERGRPRD